jgi:hypothetical protein
VGDISDDLFNFPKDQYKNYEYEDKR